MKAAIVTNLFPTPYDPERGVFTFQLVKRIKEHCDITVICPLPWFPSIGPFKHIRSYKEFSSVPSKYYIEDIEVYSPKYPLLPKISESLHSKLMTLGLRKTLLNLHKIKHFDLINSHWLYPDSVSVNQIIKAIKLPHIATGLGCDVNEYINEKGKKLQILDTLQRTNAITVVSRSLKTELIGHGINENKISVIPNGIDMSQFTLKDKTESRKILNHNPKHPHFLYVGRLSEEKGILTLLHAINLLKQQDIRVDLTLLGEGPDYPELLTETKKLMIEDQISFKGKVDHSKVSLWMGATDFFCLPSLREGCPNVILEALGCGRPIIASRVGAIPDVVNEKSGILFTPKDVNELAQNIRNALNQEWDYQVIHDSILDLTWESAAKKYFEVYRNVISR